MQGLGKLTAATPAYVTSCQHLAGMWAVLRKGHFEAEVGVAKGPVDERRAQIEGGPGSFTRKILESTCRT